MKITFLGGADEIGASSAVLKIADQQILIDAGIRMNDRSGRPKTPDFSQLGQIDAICLTHAHTDHSGALPIANQSTHPAPIFMTNGSFHLCTVLFRDALKLMSMFPEEYETPLYDEQDVLGTLNNIRMIPFGQPFPLVQNVQGTFFPAGHILGAACLLIESPEGSILFTGDFSVTPQLAVSGISVTASPDIVVTEATYGNRTHQPRKQVTHECLSKMQPILERNGKILIPAFAIGRSQEMILLLKDAMSRKIIPTVDIFVDGMINAVNSVYETKPRLLPPRLQRILRNKQSLFYTKNIRQALMPRKRILTRPGPAIIIASSGMLVGGPSTYYAQELLKHPPNALFLSGYQDEESPGRKLLELQTGDTLTIDQTNITVQAEVHKFSFSAHADSQQIRKFITTLNPKELVLTHGDYDARSALQTGWDIPVHLPNLCDTVKFPPYSGTRPHIKSTQPAPPNITLETYWNSCLKKGVQQVLIKEIENSLGITKDKIETFDGFCPNYRDPHVYTVLPPTKRQHYRKRRQRFEAYQHLQDHVILYGAQNRCHLACCQEPLKEHLAWQAFSIKKGNPVTRIDPSTILHILPNLTLPNLSQQEIRSYLLNLRDKAKPLVKSYRRALLQGPETLTLNEAKKLIKATDIIEEVALISAMTPIMTRQTEGGYQLNQKSKKTASNPQDTPNNSTIDFNQLQPQIRQALHSYPLKKIGFHDTEIILHFDFPDAIKKDTVLHLLDNIIPKFLTVKISQKTNHTAFNQLIYKYLGADGKISIYAGKKQVCLRNPVTLPTQSFKKKFQQQTGFTLHCNKINNSTIDFNQLQPQIRQALHSYPLKKIGFHDTEIILHFDFPDAIKKDTVLHLLDNIIPKFLTVKISQKVNQAAFKHLLHPYLEPNSKLSIHIEKKQVHLRNPATLPTQSFKKKFQQQTGFTLQ